MTKLEKIIIDLNLVYGMDELGLETGTDWSAIVYPEGVHEGWYDALGILFPSVVFAGWGNWYTGGTISYYGKKKYIGNEEIIELLKQAQKLQRPLTKKEIFGIASETLENSPSGRMAELGII